MNAKEMFEKLGYKLANRQSHLCYENEFGYVVTFWDKEEYVCISSAICALRVELHLAIHQQMIELGWIE